MQQSELIILWNHGKNIKQTNLLYEFNIIYYLRKVPQHLLEKLGGLKRVTVAIIRYDFYTKSNVFFVFESKSL